MQSKFRINKYLLLKCITRPRERKAVIMFYTLRQYATSGCCTNYTTKLLQISRETGFSISTIYRHLNYCLQYEIIKAENGHLYFTSSEKLCANLGYTYDPHYTWIKCKASQLEVYFRVKVYKYRLSSQRNKVIEKLKKYKDSLQPSELEKLRLYLFENYCDNFKINEPLLMLVNPDVALSQFSLSKIFGTNTQSNGWYWQQKLQQLKQIIITNRCIKSECYKKQSELKGKVFFDPSEKCTKLQLRNEVQFL